MSQYDPGDYNKSGMIAFWFSMIVTMAFFVYVSFVHEGVDLKEIPKAEAKTAESTPVDSNSSEEEGADLPPAGEASEATEGE